MAVLHTQGEWTKSGNRIMSMDHAICDVFSGTDEYTPSAKQATANAALICDAVNNTVGKGIDPNAVPQALQALKDMLGFVVSLQMLGQFNGCEDDVKEQVTNALEAITAAKLK